MNASTAMMAPSLFVLAMAGWACWSHLDVAAPPTPVKGKFEPIRASLLSPDPGTSGGRNPFLLPSRVAAAKAAETKATVTKAAKPRWWEAWLKPLSLASNRPVPNPAKAAEDKLAKARTALRRLELGGTSVGGDRKVAILSGRAYAEGDAIEGIDRAIGPVVLTEIRVTEVILNCSAGLVTVTFPDASRPSTGHKGSNAPVVAAKRPSRPRSKSNSPTTRAKPQIEADVK
jgi:hypothetical protein